MTAMPAPRLPPTTYAAGTAARNHVPAIHHGLDHTPAAARPTIQASAKYGSSTARGFYACYLASWILAAWLRDEAVALAPDRLDRRVVPVYFADLPAQVANVRADQRVRSR